jgi:hypothetical protein
MISPNFKFYIQLAKLPRSTNIHKVMPQHRIALYLLCSHLPKLAQDLFKIWRRWARKMYFFPCAWMREPTKQWKEITLPY